MTIQEAIEDIREGIKPIVGGKSLEIAIECMEEVEQYRALGTVEGFQKALDSSLGYYNQMKEYKAKLQEYEAIGTVEELKEAREKQVAKKPIEYEDKYYACPRCEGTVMYKWDEYLTKLKSKKYGLPYCLGCGQKLDWSEEDD